MFENSFRTFFNFFLGGGVSFSNIVFKSIRNQIWSDDSGELFFIDKQSGSLRNEQTDGIETTSKRSETNSLRLSHEEFVSKKFVKPVRHATILNSS